MIRKKKNIESERTKINNKKDKKKINKIHKSKTDNIFNFLRNLLFFS